jgi:SAM-dependent methyltransferase
MNVREIGCPICCGPLAIYGDTLRCPVHRLSFPRHPSGFLDLRPPDMRASGDAFAAEYRRARLAEGIEPLTSEEALCLPDGGLRGYPRLYWQVRRESWATLRHLLGRQPLALTIADLGAGVPWLSHRLAALGHRVIAVDLSPDADFGLGAARHFPGVADCGGPLERERFAELAAGTFLPILGSLEQPPLAPCAYDMVICSASLHYAADLSAAMRRMARALRRSGSLIVMDSPVGAQSRPGIGPGRILGRGELEAALRGVGLRVTFHPVKRSLLWRRRQLKNRLLRRPAFEFPLVEARADG